MTPCYATVITDASWCPEQKVAGWAAWVTVNPPNGGPAIRIKKAGPLPMVGSSGDAELMAGINGIWVAATRGADRILWQSDCEEALCQIGLFRSTKAQYIGGETIGRMVKLPWPDKLNNVMIATRHVKGHTRKNDARSYVNRWCDRHAKKYMREQRR